MNTREKLFKILFPYANEVRASDNEMIDQILALFKEAGGSEPPEKRIKHSWRWHYPSSDYRECRKCGEIRTISHSKLESCKRSEVKP